MAIVSLGTLRDLWKIVSDWVDGTSADQPKVDISDSLSATDFATETTLESIKDTDGIKKITDPLPAGTEIIGQVGIDQTTPGTTNAVAIDQSVPGTTNGVQLTGSKAEYIIPMLNLLAWSGFTNQPSDDGVEVLSDSASDVGLCTIFGTTHSTGEFAYETITLDGVTFVPTVKTDWGNIYGIFLGDIEGKNISPAVGTITVREASTDQTITTLSAAAISKGMAVFDLADKTVILNVHSGNVWKNTNAVVTTANGFKLNLTGGNIKEELIDSMIYLISDTSGATAQIEVLA